jgi:hypothetical protein
LKQNIYINLSSSEDLINKNIVIMHQDYSVLFYSKLLYKSFTMWILRCLVQVWDGICISHEVDFYRYSCTCITFAISQLFIYLGEEQFSKIFNSNIIHLFRTGFMIASYISSFWESNACWRLEKKIQFKTKFC